MNPESKNVKDLRPKTNADYHHLSSTINENNFEHRYICSIYICIAIQCSLALAGIESARLFR
ncbi:hypothetical protein BLA29_015065 [Euroglyphus maynei]|uniref:Uncharacterized protein n=1 Tax=Euroglyphus maynei TaxID=6958 RepID=A0A1Y3AZY2_EURMA|nr:hypothetical protein BLA29_015065 [Euroglyphus maynei]